MSILKNIHRVLIIILCTCLNAQEAGKEPKTFLFGLLKFDTQSEYEDGYLINKWLFAREFESPVNIIPIEIRYGVGVNGFNISSIQFFNNLSWYLFNDICIQLSVYETIHLLASIISGFYI